MENTNISPDETITVSKKAFLALLNACLSSREDAYMALDGCWDKSDDGFQDTADFCQAAIDPFEDLIPLTNFTPHDCMMEKSFEIYFPKSCTEHEKCREAEAEGEAFNEEEIEALP